MKAPLMHPATQRSVTLFLGSASHALLLAGPPGVGKRTLAEYIVTTLLNISPQPLAKYPYYLHIKPDKNSLTIEQIRQLQRFLQRKTTGRNAFRRAVLLEDAHLLTIEAQNALLKSLEEPPADTLIVLTASNAQPLKPTIVSRVQKISVLPPPLEDVQIHFSDKGDEEIAQLYKLSGSSIGTLMKLIEEPDHPLKLAITAAKNFIQFDRYERLLLVDALSKDRQSLTDLLNALSRVSRAGLLATAARGDTVGLMRWMHIADALQMAEHAQKANGNAKLLATSLALEM